MAHCRFKRARTEFLSIKYVCQSDIFGNQMLSMWKLLSTLHSEVDQILGVPWCCCPICIFLHLHCKKCSKIKRDTLQNVVVFFFFWQNKKKHHSDYIWEDICLSSGIKKWFGSTKWSSNKPSEMDGAPRCSKWDGLYRIFVSI